MRRTVRIKDDGILVDEDKNEVECPKHIERPCYKNCAWFSVKLPEEMADDKAYIFCKETIIGIYSGE